MRKRGCTQTSAQVVGCNRDDRGSQNVCKPRMICQIKIKRGDSQGWTLCLIAKDELPTGCNQMEVRAEVLVLVATRTGLCSKNGTVTPSPCNFNCQILRLQQLSAAIIHLPRMLCPVFIRSGRVRTDERRRLVGKGSRSWSSLENRLVTSEP